MSLSSHGPWLGSGTDGHLCPQWAKVNMFKSSPLICHHLSASSGCWGSHRINKILPSLGTTVSSELQMLQRENLVSIVKWQDGWNSKTKPVKSNVIFFAAQGLAFYRVEGGTLNLYLENSPCDSARKGFLLHPLTAVSIPFLCLQSFNFIKSPLQTGCQGRRQKLSMDNKFGIKKIKPSYQIELVPNAGSGLATSWKVILLPSDMALKQE